jgi:hypothetical protein
MPKKQREPEIIIKTQHGEYSVEKRVNHFGCIDYEHNEIIGYWTSFEEMEKDCKELGWILLKEFVSFDYKY